MFAAKVCPAREAEGVVMSEERSTDTVSRISRSRRSSADTVSDRSRRSSADSRESHKKAASGPYNEQVQGERKPVIWCSTTIHSITNVDAGAQQFGVLFELDFKFHVHDVVKVATQSFFDLDVSETVEVAAANVKIPFILLNVAEFEILRENHFFKEITGTTTHPPVSMYGSPEQVRKSMRWDSDMYKCEKYVIRGTFKYWVSERMEPFSDVLLMLKVATDGRPGAEKLSMRPDAADCSYPALSRNLYGYQVYTKKTKDGRSVPDVCWDYPLIEQPGYQGSYPRCYVLVPACSSVIEDWLKFYLLPCVATIFSFVYEFESRDSLAGMVSTNMLAFIALLFTLPPSNSTTFAEQAVLSFCCIQVLVGLFCLIFSEDRVHYWFGGATFGWLILLSIVQVVYSHRTNGWIRSCVSNGAFNQIDESYV